MSQLIFDEKPLKNHDFWILGIPKNAKTVIFPMFFAKIENFDKSASWWREKKIFRSGSGGPKMLFNTLLWYDLIKIWHRLIRFLHFWWFDFFDFWATQKNAKNHFLKKCNFAIFFSQFYHFHSFFVIFSCFCLQNPFLSSKF